MRESLRNSGIDIIGDVPWGTHFCQFYQTKKDLIDVLVPYFKAGLENNELCVWITSQPLEIEEAKEAMKRAVPDIDVYLEKGQMEIISYTQGYMKGGIFDPDRVVNSWVEKIDQALAWGYDGLRASGDNRWLEKEGWNGFIDYENKVDAIIDKCHVIALCPYYLDMCNTAEVIDVVSNHQFALIKRGGKWERIENSGRKRAEKEAIQAAKNWEYTFDAVPDLIAIIDDRYRIIRANRAMAARMGMTPEECVGLTCYRVIHGTSEPPSFCPHRQPVKDGAERTVEVCEDCLGGYFVVSTSPLHDSEGKTIGSIYVARDINERKKVEERLKESEEKYRNIVETANEGILIIDAETRITYANKKITEMLGYSLEELVGEFLWDFADEEGKTILKLNMEKGKQGINEVYELKLICKDDSPLWALINAKAFFNEEGGFTGSLGMFTDITDRKQEEHRIRRYNRILDGISQIFSNIVQAKTEEEVGNACLSVALEVTGSHFGFINEMGADGLLHDIAKSELGWEQCLMYDKTGHRLPPSDFVVHGLYGSVIKNEKSFFTNDPPSHPDSIGLPYGHPPITSFLGVPLVQDGKTTGLIAVANREGGYSFEQQEDLEAIAPAVMQVLQRKRSEEALKKAHENLEEKVKERTAELEKAYESLKESETGLAEAQKMAHIGNWSRDLVTGEVYWSDEMYRIYGHSPQEWGATYEELLNYIHPDDRDYFDSAVKKGLKGEFHGIDYRIILANGEERTIHAQPEVIFDENNVPIRMKGITQDITEQKKAEEKIQSLANIVESSQDAIITISLDGIVTSWNKAAEQIYGYSAEEILGKNVSILEPDIVKGEIKYFSEKIKHGKKVQHYETLRLKKGGNVIYISVTLSPVFKASGELQALSAIVRDVTERKRAEKALQESEARLRRFYESGMFGVFYFNLDGSITEANDKFLEIIGYTRVDLQAGRINCGKITPLEYRLLDEKRIAELKSIGISAPYEKEYIRKDGLHVPIIIGVATFDHECNQGIAFVLDNTERKKTEKALAEVDRIRIKEIHHRIKNNLQVISSLLDLQAEKFDDEKVREAFREGQSRVVSMSLIHEELYKGKGNDTLDFSAYLRELAEKLFQTYSLNSKNIRLLMDLKEDAFFNMDTAVPLGIIVNELVSNSFKHAFDAGEEGKVRIRLCREERKNEIHESPFSLTISDNGKGIPEDIELESLESLGLQLVNALVDQLDGKIEIKREQGTEFRIKFNVAEKS